MKTYEHTLSWMRSRDWAILPSYLDMMFAIVHEHQAGQAPSEEEIRERAASAQANRSQIGGQTSIAVIPIMGPISKRVTMMSEMSGGTSADELASQVNQAASDPSIAGIVLHVDSPGGEVSGVPEAGMAIRAARAQKPVLAVVDGMAGSGGYWLASQASEVVVTPSGEVGGIGVFRIHEDHSEALAKEGVKVTIIKAGQHKAEWNPFEPLSDSAKAFADSRVKAINEQFVETVAFGRGISPTVVDAKFGAGRMFPAEKALAAGMVDRIETPQAAISRFASKLSLSSGSNMTAESAQEVATEVDATPRLATEPERQTQEDYTMDPEQIKALVADAMKAAVPALGDQVRESVSSAVAPVAERLAALEKSTTENAERTRVAEQKTKLDALVGSGRLSPAERASEEKLLAKLTATDGDERIAELTARSPRIPSRMSQAAVLEAEGELPQVNMRQFSLPSGGHVDETYLQIHREALHRSGGDHKKYTEIAYSLCGEPLLEA